MEGYFRDDAPRMTLTLIGDNGQSDVEFVVDTAFTGMLTAPPFVLATIAATLQRAARWSWSRCRRRGALYG
jgi:predicted aspartyl protease